MNDVERYRERHREIMENARNAETREERDYWLRLGDAAAEDLATVLDPNGEWQMLIVAVLLVAAMVVAIVLLL